MAEGQVIDVVSSSDSHAELLDQIVLFEAIEQGQQTEIIQHAKELILRHVTVLHPIEIFEWSEDRNATTMDLQDGRRGGQRGGEDSLVRPVCSSVVPLGPPCRAPSEWSRHREGEGIGPSRPADSSPGNPW